jgi:hypothetical protein
MAFHVVISSSERSVFPALSSKTLGKILNEATLGDIRKHAKLFVAYLYMLTLNIWLIEHRPKKSLFTADEKSSLDDGTKLDYYVALTANVGLKMHILCV